MVVAAALLAIGFPAVAAAHANLRGTTPRIRERVEISPTQVVLRYDQAVTAFPTSIVVRSASGKFVSRAAGTAADARVVVAPLRPLAAGAYTVRWHVLSGDGHVVSGLYTFGLHVAAPPPTEAFGASGPTRAEQFVRWGYFLALALLVGGLGFQLLVVKSPLPPRAERRFYIASGLGAVAVLELGITAFMLRAQDALQLPFGRFLEGDLSPIAGGTRFGTAFIAMTLGFTLVAALLFLAWLCGRRWLLWASFLLGLGFASGLSLSGHNAVDPGSSWRSELADWVHLSAALLWIGGLVQLAFCVWPAAPALRREAFLRFSRLATLLVALVLGAGIYLSLVRLPHLHDLWRFGYGRVLLVKLTLVATALCWGAVHHFVVRPAIEREGGSGSVAGPSRSLAGESAVGMAILLATAVLVNTKPPPPPPGQPPQVSSFSPLQGAVARRPLHLDAARAASAPRFSVFVAIEQANQVAVVSGPPWRVLRRVRVPRGPHNLIASPNEEYVAVTSPPADAVSIFSARSGGLIRSVRVVGSPHDVVFGADSRTLWVTAERSGRLVELAIPSGRRLRTVSTTGDPHDVDLDPRRNQLWVTIDDSASVELRRASTGALLARPELGGAPHDVAVAPDGRSVWFSNFSSGELTVVSTRSRRATGRLRAGAEPHHFVFGLGRLWVSDNLGGTLVRIDPTGGRVLGRAAVGPSPHHATVAGDRVLVAIHGSGRISIVSRQGKLLGSLAVGPGPHGIAAVSGR